MIDECQDPEETAMRLLRSKYSEDEICEIEKYVREQVLTIKIRDYLKEHNTKDPNAHIGVKGNTIIFSASVGKAAKRDAVNLSKAMGREYGQAIRCEVLDFAHHARGDIRTVKLCTCGNEKCGKVLRELRNSRIRGQLCSRCTYVCYCDKKCQIEDWKARHKHICYQARNILEKTWFTPDEEADNMKTLLIAVMQVQMPEWMARPEATEHTTLWCDLPPFEHQSGRQFLAKTKVQPFTAHTQVHPEIHRLYRLWSHQLQPVHNLGPHHSSRRSDAPLVWVVWPPMYVSSAAK